MPSPFDQSTYQVRLDWGVAGLQRLAPADVVVVVDVLRFSSSVADAVASGGSVRLDDAVGWSRNGAAVAAAAQVQGAVVLVGGLRNASAVARAVTTLQERNGSRTSVAVIAAGEADGAGMLRFAVEDQLGAGAIIAALTDLGIDHTAPDAAVAAEGFRALRRALRHLIGASGSARELADGVAATDRMLSSGVTPTTTARAAEVDALDVVPVLREGAFVVFE
ncbi:2-phosphosulfolactate phosphatase [Microbacterium hydrocarbonoxydans]|uniref:Probable 2-phosphosulfolactate phosphatase n=1 Tax=Microbacterium hydrocarbonoxydans TaxID=273678 RepID=A0A1H4PXV0_9MICO|nr:2-phosphosulfolactate phosphatase [Microbacterium hydrocarbonoxydans]SEC12078.1 Phosphosulfolactate phosphohydrolase [Microbacterium hydrocarbonoxydans]